LWANIPPKSNRRGSFVFSAFLYRYRNLVECELLVAQGQPCGHGELGVELWLAEVSMGPPALGKHAWRGTPQMLHASFLLSLNGHGTSRARLHTMA
jgi:hypothetical protein